MFYDISLHQHVCKFAFYILQTPHLIQITKPTTYLVKYEYIHTEEMFPQKKFVYHSLDCD